MKFLKRLCFMVVTAAILMAFAGPAFATQLTSPAGTKVSNGTKVHLQSIGHWVLDAPGGSIECNHTIVGRVVADFGSFVIIEVESTGFFPCTSATVDVLKTGSISIAATSGGNGSVTSTGAEWTVEKLGLHCIYGTNNTSLGTITGGSPAKLDVSATIPRTGGKSGVFCGSSAPLTGSAEVTSPNPLLVD